MLFEVVQQSVRCLAADKFKHQLSIKRSYVTSVLSSIYCAHEFIFTIKFPKNMEHSLARLLIVRSRVF